MKTAMQEAIELVKKYDSRKISYNVLLGNLELLLEKEKEQIMKAVYDSMGTNFDPNMGRAEMYYNEFYSQTDTQESIDAGTFIADLLTKELEELGDEDLEPREEVQNPGVDPVLRLKEWDDPNTINFRWNDNDEVILRISKEGFYYRGALVEDIHNIYERFNEWLTKIE